MVRIDQLSRSGMMLATALVGGGLILAAYVGDGTRSNCSDRGPGPEQSGKLCKEMRGPSARIDAKRCIIGELLAGRMTLLEAAAHFRALDHLRPAFHWERFRAFHGGNSDEERHCLEVIAWLDQELEDSCLRLAHVSRFQSELQQHLRCGPIPLPEVQRNPAPCAANCLSD